MSELDALLKEIEHTADHMKQLAADLRDMFSQKEEPIKDISFTELRALCADRSRDGFTRDIRQLILDLGASRLSEVEPENYRQLFEKVEGLK